MGGDANVANFLDRLVFRKLLMGAIPFGVLCEGKERSFASYIMTLVPPVFVLFLPVETL